jgi:Flp pilus assembly protein TadD
MRHEKSPRTEKHCPWLPVRASLPWTRQDAAWLAGLCALVYAVYLPVLKFGFVFDDRPFILRNPWILSWRYAPRFFTAHLVAFLNPHSQGTYYRPFLLLWLSVNQKLWGLHPAGWHFSTLTLHVLAALAVYALARGILLGRLGAGVAATVFALHPVHVESTAWIMGFPDPLMTLLGVSAFACYVEGRRGKSRIWLGAALLVYAAAISTKEVALVLGPLLFVYEWIFGQPPSPAGGGTRLGTRFLNSLAPTLAFWGVTAVYLAARWKALGGFTHPLTALTWQTMVATWPEVLWRHLQLLLWPVGLSPFYDVPYVTHPGLTDFVLPLVAFTSCVLLMLLWGGKSPHVLFAAVWLFMPMLLLLNLRVFPEGEIVHDRFMYFPSVGFSFLMALAVERLVMARDLPFSSGARKVGVVAVLAIGLGGATAYYRQFWSDDLTLYTRAVTMAPASELANNNLAATEADRGRYEDAMLICERILARDPNYALAQYNLGYCQYKMGRYDEARTNLARAIALSPADPQAFVYLGLTDFRIGRMAEAAASLHQAVWLSPDNASYRFSLGMVLKVQGEWRAAREQFAAALALAPGLADARKQIAEIDGKQAPPLPAGR